MKPTGRLTKQENEQNRPAKEHKARLGKSVLLHWLWEEPL